MVNTTTNPERHLVLCDQSLHVLHISDNTSLPQCHPHTEQNNGLIMEMDHFSAGQALTDVIVYGLLMQQLIVWDEENTGLMCYLAILEFLEMVNFSPVRHEMADVHQLFVRRNLKEKM